MNQRLSCAVFLIIAALLAIPARLSSQSAGSKRATIVASPVAGGCSIFSTEPVAGAAGPDATSPGHGFDPANLDRSVVPCNDFYQFADGGWVKNHPIPADHSSWATFNQLHDKNEDALRQILEEASQDKSAAPGSNRQKIGDYYASCMDEAQIESTGL